MEAPYHARSGAAADRLVQGHFVAATGQFKDRSARVNLFRPGGDNPDHRNRGLPVMNSPEPAARPASNRSPARRIAVAVALGTLLFMALWITMFGMVTSLLIGTGCCVLIVAASSLSDAVETLLDAVASAMLGIVAVIAAIFGAIFSVFGF
jgi:hypothetical protein